MKKNNKFLSSLALAGILSTSILGLPSYAATTANTTKTEPIGVCSKIIDGKNIVPFVLSNREDKVTIKDIKDSGKFDMSSFKGSAIPSEDTVVSTGDYFKTTDGKDYTVVIYGDVDKDGSVTIFDALRIQKYILDSISSPLDEIQTIAANTIRANGSGVDIFDALQIQKYVLEKTETIVDKPHDPDAKNEVNYDYTLKVNDKNVINDVNKANSEVVISLPEAPSKAVTLKAKVFDATGAEVNIAKLNTTTPITMSANVASTKLTAVNFSSLIDGPVTIQLLNVNGEVVGSTTIQKNTVKPEAIAVRTERSSETNAKMSFVADEKVKSDIVKVYYMVVDSSVTSGVTWDATKNELKYTTDTSKIVTTDSKKVTNNELKDELITKELTKNSEYKVYYVLENSYGSVSAVKNTTILKDTLTAQTKVGTINVDENGLFAWTNPADAPAKYVVTIYRDGKIVDYKEVNKANGPITTFEIPDTSKAGSYTISVRAKGNTTTTKDSEEQGSPEFEVTALESVTDITFEVEADGTPKFSWKDEKNTPADIANYEVKLYPRNANGTYSETPVTLSKTATTGSEKEIKYNVGELGYNTVYKVEIIAVRKSDKVKLANSKETVKEGIFEIAKPKAQNVTDDSVELVFTDVRINGSAAKYQVKIYPASKRADGKTVIYNDENPTVVDAIYKDGKVLVSTGLEADHDYGLQLIANVDGMEGTAAYVPVTTSLEVPEISGLTVVKDETKATAGNIWVKSDAKEAIVNGGKKLDMTKNYPAEFKKVITLVSKLHADDKISLDNETVTLQLLSNETNTDVLDFATTAKDMTLVIENNGFGRTIKTAAGSEAKQVTLKAINSNEVGSLDVSNLKAKKIILEKDVVVNGNQKYTVSAGNATINGVKVETQEETVITASANKTLNVEANEKTNKLVFTNLTGSNVANKNATINFVGTNSSKQLGTITINTEGGSVTVNATNVDVQAKLDVTVNTGTVNVKDTEFSNTEIKVSTKGEDGALTGTTTVNAIAKTKAPDKLVSYCKASGATALDLKDYSEESDKLALKSIIDAKLGVNNALSNDELAEIINYMSSFGINNKGANLMVTNQTTEKTEVTIVFANRAVKDVVISNIK